MAWSAGMKWVVIRFLLFVSCVYFLVDADRYFSTATQEAIATAVPYCLLVLGVLGIIIGAIRYLRTRTWSNKIVGDLLLAFSATGWSSLWMWSYRTVHDNTEIPVTVVLVALSFASLVALFWGGRLLHKEKRERSRQARARMRRPELSAHPCRFLSCIAC